MRGACFYVRLNPDWVIGGIEGYNTSYKEDTTEQ